jgi:hypothetical protein
MKILRFRMRITPEECLEYYKGKKSTVVTRSVGGQTLQFPANIIHKFVTTEGIHGEFQISYTDENKLIDISRVRD